MMQTARNKGEMIINCMECPVFNDCLSEWKICIYHPFRGEIGIKSMKKAKELYENDGWYDYQPMLNEFGKILIQVDDDDYQGDSFLIYENNNKYGLLIFGWGSCSGCDALQACNNIDEVQELMDSLYNSITWFDSLQELKNYISNNDIIELNWYYHSDTFEKFRKQVLKL